MTVPWFDPITFGSYYGSIVGGVGGTLGGILGAVIGTLAPQGKGRRWVLGAMWLFILFGVSQLVLGIAALLMGQPYAIWYGPLLVGVILTAVFGSLMPVVRRTYEAAEQRRIDADGLRRG